MIPEINYELGKCGRGYEYRDYTDTILLGIPVSSHERSINHEVLHHVFFHLINFDGFKFSTMRFDWISELNCPWNDIMWIKDSGILVI